MLRLTASALLLTALASPAAAQMVTISPEQVGQIFCIGRLGNDMAPVEAMLTPALTAAIEEAEAKNALIQAQHPDEKPPLGDGIPWQSYPDYAPLCSVGAVTLDGDKASVPVAYEFPDAPDASFTDMLVLQRIPGAWEGATVWRIDNVLYATDGYLRDFLASAFTE